jgi:DNA-binding MarR family transcriptional regulator
MGRSKRREAARQLIVVAPQVGRFLRRALETMKEPEPVSVIRYAVLRSLAEREYGNAELASNTGVSTPTMSGVVDQLVRCGWVERRVDPEDRRAVRLTITDAGRREFEEVQAALIDEAGKLFEDLPAETVECLTDGFVRLEAALKEHRDDLRRGGTLDEQVGVATQRRSERARSTV